MAAPRNARTSSKQRRARQIGRLTRPLERLIFAACVGLSAPHTQRRLYDALSVMTALPRKENAKTKFPRQKVKAAAKTSAGLASAMARGALARSEWVRSGEVVPAKALSHAWGLSVRALAHSLTRGEVLAIKIASRNYYPLEFVVLQRDEVAAVRKHLAGLEPAEQLAFWKRKHGALRGQTVVQTLTESTKALSLADVVAVAKTLTAQMRAAS